METKSGYKNECNCALNSRSRSKLNPLSRIAEASSGSRLGNEAVPQTDLVGFYSSLYANDAAERKALVDFARSSSDTKGLLSAVGETFSLPEETLRFEAEEPKILGAVAVPRCRDAIVAGQRPSYLVAGYGGCHLLWSNVNLFVRNSAELKSLDEGPACRLGPELKIELLPSSCDPRNLTLAGMPKVSNVYRVCVLVKNPEQLMLAGGAAIGNSSATADPASAVANPASATARAINFPAIASHFFAHLRSAKVMVDSRFNDANARTVHTNPVSVKMARFSAGSKPWSTLDIGRFVLGTGQTLSVQKHLGFEGKFPLPPNISCDYHEEKLYFCCDRHQMGGNTGTVSGLVLASPTAFLHRGNEYDILSDCGHTDATAARRRNSSRKGFVGEARGGTVVSRVPKTVKVVSTLVDFERIYPKRCFTVNGYLIVSDERVLVLKRRRNANGDGSEDAFENIPVAGSYTTANPATFDYERVETDFGVATFEGIRFYVPFKQCLIDTGDVEVNAVLGAVFGR